MVIATIFCGCQPNKPPKTTTSPMPAIDLIIPKGEVPRMIADKFQFTEGPLWLPDRKLLIFSDIPANKEHRYSIPRGFGVFRDPSNYANGHALDADGNIITAQHDRTITKTDKDGKVTVIAKEYKGKKLNSPNDVVVADNGDIFFTDPHYGLMEGFGPQKAP